MRMRSWLSAGLCALLVLGAMSCARASFEIADLVGTWRADYAEEYHGKGPAPEGPICSHVTGVETLTLKADGTYRQVYNDGYGYVYTSPWRRWEMSVRRGRTYLHLEGGRYYPLGIKWAEKLATGSLGLDLIDDGRGWPLHLDSTTGITLNVDFTWYILQGRGEVVLSYPPCDVDGLVVVDFRRVDTAASTPVAPP